MGVICVIRPSRVLEFFNWVGLFNFRYVVGASVAAIDLSLVFDFEVNLITLWYMGFVQRIAMWLLCQ